MRFLSDLAGTLRSAFKVGNASVDSTNVSTTKTFSLLSSGGTINLIPRISSSSNPSSLTPDIANYDTFLLTALAQSCAINNHSGTPYDGMALIIRIKSAAAQTLSWDTKYRAGSISLPTSTTGNSKTDYFGFLYSSTDDKWDFVAYNPGF
jgi:hypothetical protein